MGAMEYSKESAPTVRDCAPESSACVSAQDGTGIAEFLTFGLGDERYGIDILQVQEIRHYEEPTRIADAPDYVKGVLDLRGTIVPIIDLRLKLGIGGRDVGRHRIVIVLKVRDRMLGIVVDRVLDVTSLQHDQIKLAPQWDACGDEQFVMGLAQFEDGGDQRLLILIDMDRTFGAIPGLIDATSKSHKEPAS